MGLRVGDCRDVHMVAPTVVNLRTGGKFDIYIGYGTPWQNYHAHDEISRKKKIELFERDLRIWLGGPAHEYWAKALHDLSGLRLGCHCSPQPCHGDIIVKLFLEIWGDAGTMESHEGFDSIQEAAGGEVGC